MNDKTLFRRLVLAVLFKLLILFGLWLAFFRGVSSPQSLSMAYLPANMSFFSAGVADGC